MVDQHQEHQGSNQDDRKSGVSPTTWVVRPDPDLADLIPSFMQNRQNELIEIQTGLERGDFESIRRMAHTWKGICRPYGFIHLETLSRNLEEAGERENHADVAEIVTEIREYLENVRIVYDS